jgi:hypothetical protein
MLNGYSTQPFGPVIANSGELQAGVCVSGTLNLPSGAALTPLLNTTAVAVANPYNVNPNLILTRIG